MDFKTVATLVGAALQIGGVGLAVWGTRAVVMRWLNTVRDRVTGPKPTITVAGALAAGSAEVHGYGDVKISGTLDEQLEAIKNQLSEVTKTVIANDKQVRTLTKKTEKAIEHERSQREEANTQIREAIHVNAPLATAGAILVAIGIVLTTIGALL